MGGLGVVVLANADTVEEEFGKTQDLLGRLFALNARNNRRATVGVMGV